MHQPLKHALPLADPAADQFADLPNGLRLCYRSYGHPEHPAGVNQYADLITHVADRPGHDLRYAIDAGKIQRELGWSPRETFASGLRKTVRWYLTHHDWSRRVQDGSYQRERLGNL